MVFALAVAVITQACLRAGIADLRITEIDPATGEVEVTHTASTAFTTSSALPFCHRLNYSSVVPANTTFGPGESRSFVVAGLNRLDSDLWLYRDSVFTSPGSIITGVKYGPAANVGRTSVAVAAGIWPSVGAFVPLPAQGQSLQPVSLEATPTTNWFSADPVFGDFSALPLELTGIARVGTTFTIQFTSPFPAENHEVRFSQIFAMTDSCEVIPSSLVPTGTGRFEAVFEQPSQPWGFIRLRSLP
jgi:hypothetical protein